MDRIMVLMTILCFGSFVFDVLIGKYYIISMVEYGFYFILLSCMLYNDIILPDINMIMLITILGITFILYLIYTIYRLIKSITRYKDDHHYTQKRGAETVQWRKVS